MTVGGTGDVLSGLIGGLLAQDFKPIEACEIAANTLGTTADQLAEKQTSIRAHELTEMIPKILHG